MRWTAARIGAGMALALLAVGSPRADEGLTTRSGVVPMTDEGRLVGCQAPFEVVRADPENNGGRRVRIDGRMSVISPGGTPGLMLQLAAHGPDDGPDVDGVSPALVVATDGGKDSAAERYLKDGAPADGDGLFIYMLGPVTEAALRGAASDGRFSLAYALREGGPMAPLTVDLTVKRRAFGGAGERDPGAPQAFADCLRRLRLDNLTR
jgi:hypothetical protein